MTLLVVVFVKKGNPCHESTVYCLVHEPAFGAMAGRLKGMVERVLEPDEAQGVVAQLSANMPLKSQGPGRSAEHFPQGCQP